MQDNNISGVDQDRGAEGFHGSQVNWLGGADGDDFKANDLISWIQVDGDHLLLGLVLQVGKQLDDGVSIDDVVTDLIVRDFLVFVLDFDFSEIGVFFGIGFHDIGSYGYFKKWKS